MDTEIKNAVNATSTDAQYDEKAKRLLGKNYSSTSTNKFLIL